MPNVALYNIEGTPVGEIYLDDGVFGAEINEAAIYQVVKMQLANKRQGTQSALTRGEVRGGGRKPWRQKGTGRARHGSIRSPLWVKGGVVFAPKPRDYSYTVPKKIRRLAMKSALSSKVANDEIIVLDSLKLPQPKTKEMARVLKNLKVTRKALVVLPEKDEVVQRAIRNIPGVKLAYINTLNVLDILNYDMFIATQDAVRRIEEVYA
ncbi:MAG: 50S ribosomal protein L4 [Caldicoprobacter oshimai]|uniref:Large ribosomal subunit protein uL4 n=1 Tax=Caldicoprobacter faecalis TaxID=937334 RepID=A0A1I5TYY6_9FIRM|nr:50S ribosomal protein L4 [Caldicoprobacter faecalis]PZN10480.1 MAG: 50S ribosomal protein L4 [Caldicoprobacter oshimai]SFP88272.1 large subunit ribosomal protein L4 [Caldicoprobacter faecalis]